MLKRFSFSLLLFISLILVCAPRFNRNDYGPLKYFFEQTKRDQYTVDTYGLPFDVYQYITFTQYFRGEKNKEELMRAPWSIDHYLLFWLRYSLLMH